jgi:hypothetical protein
MIAQLSMPCTTVRSVARDLPETAPHVTSRRRASRFLDGAFHPGASMACKGSGVQIPAAPLPISKGNGPAASRTSRANPSKPQFERRGRPRASNRQIRSSDLGKRSLPGQVGAHHERRPGIVLECQARRPIALLHHGGNLLLNVGIHAEVNSPRRLAPTMRTGGGGSCSGRLGHFIASFSLRSPCSGSCWPPNGNAGHMARRLRRWFVVVARPGRGVLAAHLAVSAPGSVASL